MALERRCWGCELIVELPRPSNAFQCGYCGALTISDFSVEERTKFSEKNNGGGNGEFGTRSESVGHKICRRIFQLFRFDFRGEYGFFRRSRNRNGSGSEGGSMKEAELRRRRYCVKFTKIRDRTIVTVVFLLMAFVIIGGVWTTFPLLCPFPTEESHFLPSLSFLLHFSLTLFLSLNTVFNYAMSTLRRAGKVRPVKWGLVADLPPKALEKFSFCEICKFPKPPNAHHCSQCGECVVGMDHHCPFIGNCVGVDNHRPFLLFLFFALLSCAYVFLMSLSSLFLLLPSFIELTSTARLYSASFSSSLTLDLFHSLSAMRVHLSLRLMLLIYLLCVSLASVVCVSVLCAQQLSFVRSGQTFIDTLKDDGKGCGTKIGTKRGTKGGYDGEFFSFGFCEWARETLESLRDIFGTGPIVFWVFPRFAHPVGSIAWQSGRNEILGGWISRWRTPRKNN